MMSFLILLLAIGAIVYTFLRRWFEQVRQDMEMRKDEVEMAAREYYECSRRVIEGDADPEAAALCDRTLKAYHQAVRHYEKELDRPFYRLPAHLMGFEDLR